MPHAGNPLATDSRNNREKEDVTILQRPTVTPTVYTVSLLPEDDINFSAYALTVAYRGAGMWTVTHGAGVYLDAAGEWTGDAHHEQLAPAAPRLFPLTDALRLAGEAAPSVAVNGITAADLVLRRKQEDGQ
jgi:hypothetical protein